MIPFSIELKPGIPIYEQVSFAVKKAIISGQLKAGDRFPSVREISKELKINPNTTQKVIAELVRERLLTIEPGKGSVVCEIPKATNEQLKEVLGHQIEQVVVDARRLSIDIEEVIKAIHKYWKNTEGDR